MLVLVIDVCLRSAFDIAVPGTIELVELLMVFLVFFSLAYTSLEKGHVSIGLIVDRFPQKVQTIFNIIASLLGGFIWALICLQLLLRGWENINAVNPMHTPRLLIPTYPFMFIAALGCFFLCLYFLINLIALVRSLFRK
jgi:TRAP-type C4-dicarboxylate transport system permease small subunit